MTELSLKSSNGEFKLYFCGCCSLKLFPLNGKPKKKIKSYRFNNIKEALKAGWNISKDKCFCPKDKSYIWICPDCSKKHFITQGV